MRQKVIRKQIFCKEISSNTGISQKITQIIYDEIFSLIKIEILRGNKILIKNFGNIQMKSSTNSGRKIILKKSRKGWKFENEE